MRPRQHLTEKVCSKCKIKMDITCFARRHSKPRGRASICKECRKIYMYNWRHSEKGHIAFIKSHNNYFKKYPERKKAHQIIKDAKNSGKIIPKPCEICGGKAQAHHPDYSKPLDVIWLCRQHHIDAHYKLYEDTHEPSFVKDI